MSNQNATPVAHRILIIDDNPAIHDDFRKILTSAETSAPLLEAARTALLNIPASPRLFPTFEIDSAHQGAEGVDLVVKACAAGRPYSLAFVDVRMPPGWNGIETIKHLWEQDPALQVVICAVGWVYNHEAAAGEADPGVLAVAGSGYVEVARLTPERMAQ